MAVGVSSILLVDQLGFPGNWVMAVTFSELIETPVELKSWGRVKHEYQWRGRSASLQRISRR